MNYKLFYIEHSFKKYKNFKFEDEKFQRKTFNGIELTPTATITPITYLKSWVLVISIIVIKFMVDQCPFLFEALAQVNNNTFPFQQHFKVTCDLLLPPTRACLLSFEQFIR
jgi:hypothetical protein